MGDLAMAIEFKVERDSSGGVMHDLIGATLWNGKSVPHEWYFINVL